MVTFDMAVIKKITVGFVVQSFDTEKRRFFCQEFVASDDHTWEDQMGNPLDLHDNDDLALIYGKGGVDEPFLSLEMVQPKVNSGVIMDATPLLANPTNFDVGEKVLVMPSDNPNDLIRNEFMGTVIGIKNGTLVMVKDAADDVWDCDPIQVHHVN
jgi:hypothetical protein